MLAIMLLVFFIGGLPLEVLGIDVPPMKAPPYGIDGYQVSGGRQPLRKGLLQGLCL